MLIISPDGSKEIFKFEPNIVYDFSVVIEVGQIMQWQADKKCELIAYEVCYPPYEDGRYKNLLEYDI